MLVREAKWMERRGRKLTVGDTGVVDLHHQRMWRDDSVSTCATPRAAQPTAHGGQMTCLLTCLYVLTTLSEFETVSEMTEAQKPIKACLASF